MENTLVRIALSGALFSTIHLASSLSSAAGSVVPATPVTNNQAVADASSCPMHFPSQNLCATLLFDTPPAVGEEAKFRVEFRASGNGQPTDPIGDVSVYLWMPDMGHGSAPVTLVHGATPGVFDVSKAYFLMDGSWEVHVELKKDSTVENAFVLEMLGH